MYLDLPLSTFFKLGILRYCKDKDLNPAKLWFCERSAPYLFEGYLLGLLKTSGFVEYYPCQTDYASLRNAFHDIEMWRCTPGQNANDFHAKFAICIYDIEDSLNFLAKQESRMSLCHFEKFLRFSHGIWILTAEQCEREHPTHLGKHAWEG